MKITREFLRALMTGKAALRDVKGSKGVADIDKMGISFKGGVACITLFSDGTLPVATIEAQFDPANGGTLYLGAGSGFTMQLEVELHE